MSEDVYIIFNRLLKIVIRNYSLANHEISVEHIKYSMKNIYENKEAFKFVFEQYYSDKRNPFTNAYSQFMNYYDTFGEKSFYLIAEGILVRTLQEKRTNDEYVVY